MWFRAPDFNRLVIIKSRRYAFVIVTGASLNSDKITTMIAAVFVSRWNPDFFTSFRNPDFFGDIVVVTAAVGVRRTISAVALMSRSDMGVAMTIMMATLMPVMMAVVMAFVVVAAGVSST